MKRYSHLPPIDPSEGVGRKLARYAGRNKRPTPIGAVIDASVLLGRATSSVLRLRHLNTPPIVLGGCGRSGTTLLLSVLSALPQIVAIPNETYALCHIRPGSKPPITAPDWPRLYRFLMLTGISKDARRWCEKTPRNVEFYEPLIRYFDGNIRIINIIRDGRDVVTSRHRRAPEKFWVSPERWVRTVRMGLAASHYEQVLSIRYEDLVMNYEITSRQICDFVGEEYCGAIARWHESASVRANEAWDGEVKPLHSKSIGKWRNGEFEDVLSRLYASPGANELLAELGYI